MPVSVRQIAFLLLTIGGLLAAGKANAQFKPDQETAFQFPKGRHKVRIPFKLIHNLIIIPLQINDSKTLHFVVDTGVNVTLIIETGQYDSISLIDVKQLFIRGLGQGEGVEALLSQGNRMRLAGLEARNQEIMVLGKNIFDISARVGMEVNGIIGYPLFKEFVVDINYANRVMTLYKPGHYPARRLKKSVTIPLTIQDNKPYVELEVIAQNGDKHPVKLIVDTGMSSTMLLYPTSLPDSFVPDQTIAAYLGRGLNGDIHGNIGRIKAIRLGSFLLERPMASFPDSLSVRHSIAMHDRHGNLGADILQRFRVVFDYKNGQMQLTPNYKFNRPFYYNLSGMELISPLPGYNVYAIADVLPNSPASKAGLKKGDSIISINGKNCFLISYEDVLHHFQNWPGRTLTLRVSRDAEVFTATLQLQDLI